MNLSLNETDALAKKAARGAGLPWGVAEEVGKATKWLCAQGLDGCAILADALNAGDTNTLYLGLSLADTAANDNQNSDLGFVRTPLLFLPFLALAARQSGTPKILRIGSAHAITDGSGLYLSVDQVEPGNALLSDCDLAFTPRATKTRATPTTEALETLNAFAHRTYAPATEESRLLGAGAGLSDND